MKKGLFITFEGTDGVGKSTQIRLLEQWLSEHGHHVVLTREPGGGRIAEKIRTVLLDPSSQIDDVTELFLYEAARADHMHKIIGPALKGKKVVLCDRFTDATVAYQGFARNLSLKTIEILNQIATKGRTPDLTIWLDLPPREGLGKAQSRSHARGGDRLENEGLKFQKQVYRGYLHQFKHHPERVVRIRVHSTIEKTQEDIRRAVSTNLSL